MPMKMFLGNWGRTLVITLLLVGSIFALALQIRASSGSSVSLSAPHSAVALADSIPTSTPYPLKPGETGVPTPFPTVILPPMTAVPVGSEDNFNDDRTPSVGYTPVPTHQPSDPYNIAMYPRRMTDINFLAPSATTIISGTVIRIDPARWSTLDGLRPLNPWSSGNTANIITPVLVQVASYLKGSQTGPDVLVMALTGTVGQDSVGWDDNLHTFTTGEQVIIFLNKRGVDPSLLIDKRSPWQVIEHYTITSGGSAVNSYQTLTLQQVLSHSPYALRYRSSSLYA